MKAMKKLANKHLLGQSSSKRKLLTRSLSNTSSKSLDESAKNLDKALLSPSYSLDLSNKLSPQIIPRSDDSETLLNSKQINAAAKSENLYIKQSTESWKGLYNEINDKYQILYRQYTALLNEKRSVQALMKDLEKEQMKVKQLKEEIQSLKSEQSSNTLYKEAQIKISEQNEEIQKLLEKQLLLETKIGTLRYEALDLNQDDNSSHKSQPTNFRSINDAVKLHAKKKKTWWGKSRRLKQHDTDAVSNPDYDSKYLNTSDVSHLNIQILELEKFKEEASAEISMLEKEKEKLRKQLKQAELQVEALQKSIASEHTENPKSMLETMKEKKLHVVVQAQEETIARLTTEVKNLETSLKLVTNPPEKTENLIKSLKTTLSTLQEKAVKLQEENISLVQENKEFELLRDSLLTKIENLKSEYVALKETCAAENTLMKERADKYAVMVGNLLQQKDFLQAELSKLRNLHYNEAVLNKDPKTKLARKDSDEDGNINSNSSDSSSQNLKTPTKNRISRNQVTEQISVSTAVPVSTDVTPKSYSYSKKLLPDGLINPVVSVSYQQNNSLYEVNPADQLLTRSILRKWNEENQKEVVAENSLNQAAATANHEKKPANENTIVYRNIPLEKAGLVDSENSFLLEPSPVTYKQKQPQQKMRTPLPPPVPLSSLQQAPQSPRGANMCRKLAHTFSDEKKYYVLNQPSFSPPVSLVDQRAVHVESKLFPDQSNSSSGFKNNHKTTEKRQTMTPQNNGDQLPFNSTNQTKKETKQHSTARNSRRNSKEKPGTKFTSLESQSTASFPTSLEKKTSIVFINDLDDNDGHCLELFDAKYSVKPRESVDLKDKNPTTRRRSPDTTANPSPGHSLSPQMYNIPDLTSQKLVVESCNEELGINESLHRMFSNIHQTTFFETQNSPPKLELEAAAKLFNFQGSLDKLDKMFEEMYDNNDIDVLEQPIYT